MVKLKVSLGIDNIANRGEVAAIAVLRGVLINPRYSLKEIGAVPEFTAIVPELSQRHSIGIYIAVVIFLIRRYVRIRQGQHCGRIQVAPAIHPYYDTLYPDTLPSWWTGGCDIPYIQSPSRQHKACTRIMEPPLPPNTKHLLDRKSVV